MTNLQKLHLLGSIKIALTKWSTYIDLIAFLMLTGGIVCSVLLLQAYKIDNQASTGYADYMVSLEEIER